MRLIDADALKRTFAQNLIELGVQEEKAWRMTCEIYPNLFGRIDKIPTIEAEPIKHGHWVWNKRLGDWYCSNCDRIMNPYTVEKSEGLYEMAQPFYCGWCGARMDGGENG